MPATGQITGIETVMSGLNKKLIEYQTRGTSGLRSAVAFIRRDMEMTPPRIPVDTGNLRSSWFVETVEYKRNRQTIFFGFNANYAAFVHENIGADFTSPRVRYGPGKGRKRIYTPRPGAGPKFLEAALKRNTYKILLIIRKKMTSSGELIR